MRIFVTLSYAFVSNVKICLDLSGFNIINSQTGQNKVSSRTYPTPFFERFCMSISATIFFSSLCLKWWLSKCTCSDLRNKTRCYVFLWRGSTGTIHVDTCPKKPFCGFNLHSYISLLTVDHGSSRVLRNVDTVQ